MNVLKKQSGSAEHGGPFSGSPNMCNVLFVCYCAHIPTSNQYSFAWLDLGHVEPDLTCWSRS